MSANAGETLKRLLEDLDTSFNSSIEEQASKSCRTDENISSAATSSSDLPPRRVLGFPVFMHNTTMEPDKPTLPPKLSSKTTKYNISTQNSFDPLIHSNNTSDLNKKVLTIQKTVVPPFVIVGATDFAKAIKIVCKHAKDNYTVRYMNIGTKVQVSEITAYMDINNELKAEGIRYFTHDIDELKIKKFVISGLPCTDISEIENSLTMQKVNFINIQEVIVKNSRFDKECIYIVSFKANITNLSELERIKFVNRVSVKWSDHKNKNKGPTQCRNCYMFGHGMRNCHLPKKCIKCGSTNHSLDSCDANDEGIKCANCKGNHMADFAACESRSKFIDMRLKFSTKKNNNEKNDKNGKKVEKSKGFSSKDYDKDFPDKYKNGRTPKINAWGPKNRHEDPASSSHTEEPRRKGATRTTNENADLFTTEEIIAITKDVFASLANCKSKEDQLGVIVKLSAKYLYGQP